MGIAASCFRLVCGGDGGGRSFGFTGVAGSEWPSGERGLWLRRRLFRHACRADNAPIGADHEVGYPPTTESSEWKGWGVAPPRRHDAPILASWLSVSTHPGAHKVHTVGARNSLRGRGSSPIHLACNREASTRSDTYESLISLVLALPSQLSRVEKFPQVWIVAALSLLRECQDTGRWGR